jgi:outer membrane protein OmpA-like peptidoglycan-associated protein
MARRRLFLGLLLASPAMGWVSAQPLGTPATPAVTLPPMPPLRFPRGMSELPQGAWRVTFPADRDTLDPEQRAALERLGAALQASTIGRVQLNGEASGGEDLSSHRRLTLARARAVKAALVAGGLAETRVDIRALGRTENGRDAVDILSPTAPR